MGSCEEPLDDGPGHGVQGLSVILGQPIQHGLRPGQLDLADALALARHGPDATVKVGVAQPGPAAPGFFVDDALRVVGRLLAGRAPGLGHLPQVVDIETEDAVEPVHGRVDVAGHGQVDEDQRAKPSPACDLGQLNVLDEEASGRGAGHHDVDTLQVAGHLIQWDGRGTEVSRNLGATREGTVGDGQFGQAVVQQRPGYHPAVLSRSDEQGRPAFQAAQHLAREFDAGPPDAHRLAGDPGLATHALCHQQSPVHHAVQHRPCRVALLGDAVGLTHLADDLRLAQDHRVQAAGHAKQVPDRSISAVLVQVGQCPARDQAATLGQPGRHLGNVLAFSGHSVQFHPVAGRQQQGFGAHAFAAQIPEQLGDRRRRHGQPLPHFDRSRVVAETHRDEAGAHALSQGEPLQVPPDPVHAPRACGTSPRRGSSPVRALASDAGERALRGALVTGSLIPSPRGNRRAGGRRP